MGCSTGRLSKISPKPINLQQEQINFNLDQNNESKPSQLKDSNLNQIDSSLNKENSSNLKSPIKQPTQINIQKNEYKTIYNNITINSDAQNYNMQQHNNENHQENPINSDCEQVIPELIKHTSNKKIYSNSKYNNEIYDSNSQGNPINLSNKQQLLKSSYCEDFNRRHSRDKIENISSFLKVSNNISDQSSIDPKMYFGNTICFNFDDNKNTLFESIVSEDNTKPKYSIIVSRNSEKSLPPSIEENNKENGDLKISSNSESSYKEDNLSSPGNNQIHNNNLKIIRLDSASETPDFIYPSWDNTLKRSTIGSKVNEKSNFRNNKSEISEFLSNKYSATTNNTPKYISTNAVRSNTFANAILLKKSKKTLTNIETNKMPTDLHIIQTEKNQNSSDNESFSGSKRSEFNQLKKLHHGLSKSHITEIMSESYDISQMTLENNDYSLRTIKDIFQQKQSVRNRSSETNSSSNNESALEVNDMYQEFNINSSRSMLSVRSDKFRNSSVRSVNPGKSKFADYINDANSSSNEDSESLYKATLPSLCPNTQVGVNSNNNINSNSTDEKKTHKKTKLSNFAKIKVENKFISTPNVFSEIVTEHLNKEKLHSSASNIDSPTKKGREDNILNVNLSKENTVSINSENDEHKNEGQNEQPNFESLKVGDNIDIINNSWYKSDTSVSITKEENIFQNNSEGFSPIKLQPQSKIIKGSKVMIFNYKNGNGVSGNTLSYGTQERVPENGIVNSSRYQKYAKRTTTESDCDLASMIGDLKKEVASHIMFDTARDKLNNYKKIALYKNDYKGSKNFDRDVIHEEPIENMLDPKARTGYYRRLNTSGNTKINLIKISKFVHSNPQFVNK